MSGDSEIKTIFSAIPVAEATVDPLERELYAHDLAAVPSFLSRALLRAVPDVVARPRMTEEVAAVLKYASNHSLPVTPRAAGSTAFYNSVPAKGGILLDLNALLGLVEVNEAKRTATVAAATRWKELDDELRYSWGLAVKTCPTSAPSATVGGWFNMGGLGIGSLTYGPLRDLVVRVEVVLPTGEVRTLSTDSDISLFWFAGAEGTLGIITKLELSLREAPEATSSHLLAFADVALLQQAANALTDAAPRPYYLHFADAVYAEMTKAAGFASPVQEDLPSLFVRYEGSPDEVEAGIASVRAIGREYGGTPLSEVAGEEAWAHRYSDVRIKRAGPSLLGVEILLPLSRLRDFVASARKIGRHYGEPVCTYGSVVAGELVQLNAFFPSDERLSVRYLFSLGLTKRLHDASRRLGGHIYGVGLWNTPFVRHSNETRERDRRKHLLDPGCIMNPGKLYAPPAQLSPPFFGLAMDTLAMLHRVVVKTGV